MAVIRDDTSHGTMHSTPPSMHLTKLSCQQLLDGLWNWFQTARRTWVLYMPKTLVPHPALGFSVVFGEDVSSLISTTRLESTPRLQNSPSPPQPQLHLILVRQSHWHSC